MKTLMTALAGVALFAAVPATATTVDFETTPSGYTANPLTIGDATFSGPVNLYVGDLLFDGNQQICSNLDDGQCTGELDVTFASAISGLSFTASSDDSASTLTILLSLAGGGTQLVNFLMDGDPYNYSTVNLSSYGNLLGVSLNSDDELGLTYDDFTYSAAVEGGVPEPSTWAMMLVGFGAIGFGMRRRKKTERTLRLAV